MYSASANPEARPVPGRNVPQTDALTMPGRRFVRVLATHALARSLMVSSVCLIFR